jgi:LysW-gamma-L-alpha-aminoadipyl-6-phosphate/LysW-L-glutamyl-5-phosphate reductase
VDELVRVARPSDPTLAALLASHPGVWIEGEGGPGLAFWQGDWRRSVVASEPGADVYGLVELMDNNPMVCADRVSVPGLVGTVAAIAFGPLVRAGLVTEQPSLLLGSHEELGDLEDALVALGWGHGALVADVGAEPGPVVTARALVAVPTPDDLADLDSLYEEAYGRSLYVRLAETFDPAETKGRPYAVCSLAVTPDEPVSLLSVSVALDRRGKGGAAQLVHAFNVAAGFEESLGIPESLPVL